MIFSDLTMILENGKWKNCFLVHNSNFDCSSWQLWHHDDELGPWTRTATPRAIFVYPWKLTPSEVSSSWRLDAIQWKNIVILYLLRDFLAFFGLNVYKPESCKFVLLNPFSVKIVRRQN